MNADWSSLWVPLMVCAAFFLLARSNRHNH